MRGGVHGKLNSSAFNAKRKLSKVGVQVGFFLVCFVYFLKKFFLGTATEKEGERTICRQTSEDDFVSSFWENTKGFTYCFLLAPNTYLSLSVTGAVAVTQTLSESRMN